MERHLSAVFAADMVGYSRLMEADEVGTLNRQKAHRRELIDPAFDEFHGRIVKEMGDGILVEFPSVIDAVQCAVTIQRAMPDREGEVSEDRRIAYRIGINLGDIIVEGDDIYGDGVNVAARLEQMAEPGGICISGTAYDQMRSTVEVGYEALGEMQVKNIDRPIRAYKVLIEAGLAGAVIEKQQRRIGPRYWAAIGLVLLLALAAGGWWWTQQPDFEPVDPRQMALELPDGPSIAVLPFDYIGADKTENEFLADGLSENITTYLSRIPEMTVIARNSSFTYKDKPVDVREVSKRFGVRYVLEGSVQRSGEEIRVTAQLIDAVTGNHIWSDTYDRTTDDYFQIQDEIAYNVASATSGETVTGYRGFLENEKTNIVAFGETMAGAELFRLLTSKGNKMARAHFERALEADPEYVVPYAYIAYSHILDLQMGFTADPQNSLKLAESWADKALSIDPENPAALGTLARIRVTQQRPEEAKALIERAVDQQPSNAGLAATAGWIYRNINEPRTALSYLRKARRSSPTPIWGLYADEFEASLDVGEYAAALEIAEPMLDASPEYWRNRIPAWIALAHYKLGDLDAARAMVDEALRLTPTLSLSEIRLYYAANADKSKIEWRFEIWRKLGIPEYPTSN